MTQGWTRPNLRNSVVYVCGYFVSSENKQHREFKVHVQRGQEEHYKKKKNKTPLIELTLDMREDVCVYVYVCVCVESKFSLKGKIHNTHVHTNKGSDSLRISLQLQVPVRLTCAAIHILFVFDYFLYMCILVFVHVFVSVWFIVKDFHVKPPPGVGFTVFTST